MNTLHAVILGVVEGLTEFLPVSSTGHLMLAAKLMGLPQTEFMKTFEIAIQTGAILSVVVLFGPRFLLRPIVWGKVLAAFVPTAVIGALSYSLIKRYLFADARVVLWALFIGGILIIIFERIHQRKEEGTQDIASISWKHCVYIGLFQSAAMVPGVSRAAATILGGLFLGLRRQTIVEFSFLLAVPTLLGATVLDLTQTAHVFSGEELRLLAVGLVTSFAVAVLAIKMLLFYVRHNSFTPFGIYRILLCLFFWFLHTK